MKKRLIAIFLCLLMLFALLPAAVADGEPEEPVAEEPVAEEPAAEEPAAEEPAEAPEDEPVLPELPEAEEPAEEAPALAEEPETVADEPEELTDAEMAERAVILINEQNFPDENFRKWIVANVPGVTVDANGVCSITSEDAKKITTIIINGQDVTTLSGIKKFSKLEVLDCAGNKLKYLDVNGLKELTFLDCSNNSISKLTIGSDKKLVTLYADNNKLESVSLKYATALKTVSLTNNALKSLDVSALTALEHLFVTKNALKKLDLSKNTKLKKLDCERNNLTALDLSKNTALEELTMSYNELKKIDLTKNTKLRVLIGRVCSLTAIDLTKNTELTYVDIGVNELTKLDVTKNTKLLILDCTTNVIKSIDVTKNTLLQVLNVDGCGLSAIDISKNTALIEFTAYDNYLKTLDVTNNKDLVRLSLSSNELKTITLSNNTKLEDLDITYNELTALDLSSNTKLKKLQCYGNCLKMLDLSMLPDLKEENAELSEQEFLAPTGITYSGGDYKFDMNTMFSTFDKIELETFPLNKITGMVTVTGYVDSINYLYDTGRGKMKVKLFMPYNGPATVEFMKPSVDFKGTTPYVVYDGKEKKPTVIVKNADGAVITSNRYTVAFSNNVNPGTATVTVSFINTMNTASGWFKILLPGPKTTTVENTDTGIKIKWDAVDKAIGYVIYRRAWNLSSGAWTTFQRWNNTTATEWTDTTVYAGTRYQYGIKAYFTNAFDTNNLGNVGPLKTTARVTTRTLLSVEPHSGSLTVKWETSKYCQGYEVQYAKNSTFTDGVKTAKIKSWKTGTKSISSLKSGVTYYVRVRGYYTIDDMTYYGAWSNVLSAKVK